MKRILSGVRSSGKIHIGNYMGAIKNWIELQNDKETKLCIFMIADYHGITTPYDPKTYPDQIMELAIIYLAAGLNPEKTLLIRQSKIPEHTELTWILNTITPVSWLNRLPTYQEQIEKSPKSNNIGLLDYPVLQAADILVYKSNFVPVGKDQLPHIDLTNEIAKRFNHIFGETFPIIKPSLTEGAKIMSLQNPLKKMSKTGDEEGSINLTDTPDEIYKKIKKAVTDSGKDIIYNPEKKPAISNLIMTYHLISGKEIKEIEKEYEGKNYSEFKKNLAELVISFLEPFQKKYQEISQNKDYVESVLTKSEENAKNIASQTLKEVKQKIGVEK